MHLLNIVISLWRLVTSSGTMRAV
uniref:Uncharacterized protein n=1 Tax=Anguilla anguilla TaxID=7936 RepID=A0A0E9TYR2_ANGAN